MSQWREEAKAAVDDAAARMKRDIDAYCENGYTVAQGEIDVWLSSENGWSHKLFVPFSAALTNPQPKSIGERIMCALGLT